MPSFRSLSSHRASAAPSPLVAVLAGTAVAGGLAAVGRTAWVAAQARRFAAVRGPRFERGAVATALPAEASA